MAATTRFPVVLVHGLFGYGRTRPLWNKWTPYWPEKEIQAINTNVLIVDVGSVSSDHDRACEAFYQLFGGTVDYGADHANETRHARFGQTYERGMHPTWSADDPVHLVGHSMGATTAIDLYQLICADAFGVGTDHRWVRSITCIAGPLTGTLLSHTLDIHGDEVVPFTPAHFLSAALGVYFQLYNSIPVLRGLFDLKMDQWRGQTMTDAVSSQSPALRSLDIAMFSCQPARRIQKNSQLQHMDRVFLMSITTSPRHFTIAKREVAIATATALLLLAKRSLWAGLAVPKWLQAASTRRWTALVLVLWLWTRVRRWNLAKMPSFFAIAWLMRRRARSLHAIYDGFDADHWQHNDGAVNIHSMLRPWFPKPQELVASRSSPTLVDLANQTAASSNQTTVSLGHASTVSRCLSHISIDGIYRASDDHASDDNDHNQLHTEEPRAPRFRKGRWYVYRVDSNHLAGTYWDRDAADLYRSLFMMIIDEYEGGAKEVSPAPSDSSATHALNHVRAAATTELRAMIG